MIRDILLSAAVLLAVCLFVFAANDNVFAMLGPVADGEGARLTSMIQQQRAERLAIARNARARKEEIAKEQAPLVEKMKREMAERLVITKRANSVVLAAINFMSILFAAVFIVFVLLYRPSR